ncbi:NAD(P)-binding protein [Aulographum hederae CBS 113979]|uniref:NAD(P)-binding protein n=1 Tax=Aulographum hederae CBS 113979 TaxID=1176131 RepID=A0A6G1H1N6_9PEZI|nr:NAD(P)-binding protein [Aulographum hederae CBS 113979]
MDTTQRTDPSDLFSAKGLVIVITGAGSGIGLSFTKTLHSTSPHKIYALARRLPLLQSIAASLDPSGTVITPLECDITSPTSIAAAVSHIEKETGYIDVLINNAGVTGPDHRGIYEAGSIEQVRDVLLGEWEKWEATYATNTTAVVGVSAAFLPLLDRGNERRGWVNGKLGPGEGPRERKTVQKKEKGDEEVDMSDERTSQIITVASIAAFNRHVTAGFAYSASKAGAVSVGKTLATALAGWGVRSNVIAPGIYPSDMTTSAPKQFPVDKVPAGRQGSLGEIGGAVLYLVGKSGAYVNGDVLITDGGRLSVHPATY